MANLTPGTVHLVHVKDFPWTDSWAKAYHASHRLMTEAECRKNLEGQQVIIIPDKFTNSAVTGDRGMIKMWVCVRALTGPRINAKIGVATDWLTAVPTCQCSDKVIWSKGCQCGGS